MSDDRRLEDLLARYVEHHVAAGDRLSASELCAGDRGLLARLAVRHRAAITRLADRKRWTTGKDGAPSVPHEPKLGREAQEDEPLPVIDGFRTIERIGAGGMGEVYKLRDLKLDRFVAAKVIRRDPRPPAARRLPARSPIDGAVRRSAHRAGLRGARRRRPAGDHHGARRRLRAGPRRPVARVRPARRGFCARSAARSTTRIRRASSTAT